ncbi:hypothetical protein C900_05143 [Fulvivirga imtechensis AK7]|uniref:Uncharacterized protein n=1 Tax=Fulvivirga imtechensis AK7 TaxID=1237149 RepID=L8JGR9_9BACT|nr:hypothetical protein C900_01266 [Fulvivirga imtechensis AK7]ELR69363.1 hypothetical protein C900_05143 [Fulvivirga imtechensis AK7]
MKGLTSSGYLWSTMQMGGTTENRNLKWLQELEEPYDGRPSRTIL